MGGSVNTESVLFAVSDHESAHIVYLFLRRRRELRVGPEDTKSWRSGHDNMAAKPTEKTQLECRQRASRCCTKADGGKLFSGVADSRGTLDGYCFLGFVSTSVIRR